MLTTGFEEALRAARVEIAQSGLREGCRRSPSTQRRTNTLPFGSVGDSLGGKGFRALRRFPPRGAEVRELDAGPSWARAAGLIVFVSAGLRADAGRARLIRVRLARTRPFKTTSRVGHGDDESLITA